MRQFTADAPRRFNRLRLAIVFLLLAAPVCAAVWSVEWFVTQDGSAHLYTAHLLVELLKGNPVLSEVFAINPLYVPNSSGHWLLAALLLFFAPAVVSKIFVTLTFLANVWAIVYLCVRVAGRNGLETAVLLAMIIAINGLWFLGFYNFNLGTALFAATIGYWWKRRENFALRHAIVLSLLLIANYFSHLISFGMTTACLMFLAVFASEPRKTARNFLWIAAALLPVVPLLVGYKLMTGAGGEIAPHWRELANPYSPASWAKHLFMGDPVLLLARQSFPFVEARPAAFLAAAPSVWFIAALACLALACFAAWRRGFRFPPKIAALANFGALCALAWAVAPDDFGTLHGGVLRERILIIGFICLAPVLCVAPAGFFKRAAQIILIYVALFQIAVLFEYAQTQNRITIEFVAATPALDRLEKPVTLASIIMSPDICRYKSAPLINLDPLLGVGNSNIVWDNYELGNYYFPVVARSEDARRFSFDFHEANKLNYCYSNEIEDYKFVRLNEVLRENHNRINTMLVWGANERVEEMLAEWYESEPFYKSENVRLFRHK